jgi:hypothetical protein
MWTNKSNFEALNCEPYWSMAISPLQSQNGVGQKGMLMAASGSGEFLAPNTSPDWCTYTEESHLQSSFPHFLPTEVMNNFLMLPNKSESSI